MLHSLRMALSGRGAKPALNVEQDGSRTPFYDSQDVECPSSNGLVNRNSSRSSSPVNSVSAETYRTPVSPRQSEKLAQHSSSRSAPQNLPSYLPGKSASAARGRQRHQLVLLVLLLPALTGLAVMCVRLRSSETEHSLILPPSATVYAWREPEEGGRMISNLQYPEGDVGIMHPQSYAQMRYRNRDRLPKWAKRAVNAVTDFFKKDPVATYLLREGPWAWTWLWLTKKKPWPAPLWDKHALVPDAEFLWGSPGQLCSIINASDTVALVGNGPLTSEQRQEINTRGAVVRINALNNRMPGDKIDVWLCRYNGLGPANYWGFKQLSYREAEEVVRSSQGVLFLGGHPTKLMAYAVEELLTWYPFLPVEKTLQVNITGYWDLYNRVLSDKTSLTKAGAMPSSGLLAALATAPCMRPAQKLHVYGFNWNKEAWFMHKMDSEQKIINRLFSGLDVTIHPTACDGMYTCHKLCDGLFYRIAKDGDKAVCEAKALQDKKRKAQQALERKQRRNAAMQAMLAKPGYQGALQAPAIEMAHEDSDWILDGSQRPAKLGGAVPSSSSGGQITAALDPRGSLKYTKSDKVSAIVAKADGNLYNEQGTRLGNAEDMGTGDEDLLHAAALEEFAEAAEAKAAAEFRERSGAGAGALQEGAALGQAEAEVDRLQDDTADDVDEEEEEEQEQEGEEDKMDDLLTEEAAYPTESQGVLGASKRSAADAAAQAAVDDMLAEQEAGEDADGDTDEAADEAEEQEDNLDESGDAAAA